MRRTFPALVVFAALLAACPSAAAAPPPCGPDATPAVDFTAPDRVDLRRRDATFYLSADPAPLSQVDGSTLRVAFVPARPGGKLTFAYFGLGTEKALDPSIYQWPLRFAAGDEAGIAAVTYEEEENYTLNRCQRTFSQRVEPVARGNLPDVVFRRGSDYDEDTGDPYNVLDVTLRSGNCAAASIGVTTVTFSGAGETRRFRLSDPCGRWAKTRTARTFQVELTPSGEQDASIRFIPVVRPTGTASYTVTSEFDGRVLARQKFQVMWKLVRRRAIYEEEDDFQNICINDNRTIFRKQGRYYCVDKGYSRRRIKLLGGRK